MCIIALVLYLIINFSCEKGQLLVVYKDNEVIGKYSLNDEGYHTIEYDDMTLMTFEIKNGKAEKTLVGLRDKEEIKRNCLAIL